MNVGILSNSTVTLILAFAFSLVGCLLTLHSFVRGINTTRRGRRFGWFILAAWALAATAVWDMFLVVAIDLQSDGLQVRYDVISIVASIAASVVVSAAILWLISTRPSTVATLLGGAIIGVVMALDSYLVLTAIRANAVVTFRTPTIIVGGAVLAITTAIALLLALRARSRAVVTWTAASLAVVMTAAHYLNLDAVEFSEPLAPPTSAGIVSTAVIVPAAIVFVVRFLLLLFVVSADSTATTPIPRHPSAARG